MGGLSQPVGLPVLSGAGLRFEPVGPEHRALLVALNADPDVMRFVRGRAGTPEETLAEWDERLGARSDAARGLGYWAGFVDDSFAGWWSAAAFATQPSWAGLGYRLRRSFWGRGLATEGARVMVDQAFSSPGVDRIVASTMAVNHASRRVLARVGLSQTDSWVRESDDCLTGWEQGQVRYDLTRAEWAARR